MPLGSPTHPGQALQGTQIPPPREVLACPGPGRHGPDNPLVKFSLTLQETAGDRQRRRRTNAPASRASSQLDHFVCRLRHIAQTVLRSPKWWARLEQCSGIAPPFLPPGPFWAACVPQRCELHIFMVEPGRAACPPRCPPHHADRRDALHGCSILCTPPAASLRFS